ncbi:hypothetical protein JCM8097_005169 [Rhodosporidiobolus ruineniae]
MSYAPAQQPQPQTTKTGQISELARKLHILAERTEQLEQLSATTAEQASYMRLLGGYHAAWFMASQRIMIPGTTAADDGAQDEARQ